MQIETDHPNEGVLDHLLKALDVSVEAFAVCEVRHGRRLVGGTGGKIEVHYVLAGTMHLSIPGQPAMIFGPGSVVLVPPGLEQIIAADDLPASDVFAADHCTVARDGMLLVDAADGGKGDLRMVCGIVSANISGSLGLLDSVTGPIGEDLGELGIVRQCYAQILDELTSPELGSRALAGAMMKTCLILLLRRHFARADHDTRLLSHLRDPRLGRAVATVLDQPAAAHSVASLACAAGMSRSAFARDFSEAFGTSPMMFVARTRLAHGAELLRSTRLPVKRIAAMIGFSSRSHFSRAFTARYGADPSRYRLGNDAAPAGRAVADGAAFRPTLETMTTIGTMQ